MFRTTLRFVCYHLPFARLRIPHCYDYTFDLRDFYVYLIFVCVCCSVFWFVTFTRGCYVTPFQLIIGFVRSDAAFAFAARFAFAIFTFTHCVLRLRARFIPYAFFTFTDYRFLRTRFGFCRVRYTRGSHYGCVGSFLRLPAVAVTPYVRLRATIFYLVGCVLHAFVLYRSDYTFVCLRLRVRTLDAVRFVCCVVRYRYALVNSYCVYAFITAFTHAFLRAPSHTPFAGSRSLYAAYCTHVATLGYAAAHPVTVHVRGYGLRWLLLIDFALLIDLRTFTPHGYVLHTRCV